MKAAIITQDDPFFLPDAMEQLCRLAKGRHEFVGCVMLSASPFGKRESFAAKALKTWRIFGTAFFVRYAARFLGAKLIRRRSVADVLSGHSVPIVTLEQSINHKQSLEVIGNLGADVLVSIVGNEIFRRPLLDLAPRGCLNLHTALLPKYRGLMPSFWVLKNRESHTGVSVFLVDEGIDTGPIVVQRKVEIGDMSQDALIRETKQIGMEMIVEAMDLLENEGFQPAPNNDADATYFGFPTREDVKAFRAAGARFF